MHLLVLPSFYSDPDQPLCGSFFREQALALSRGGTSVGVAYVEPRSLRRLRPGNLLTSHFQVGEYRDHGLHELRLHGWNPLLGTLAGGRVWSWLSVQLFARYLKRFGVPDLIHAHNSLYGGYAAMLIGRRYGIPYLVTEHHSSFLKGTLSAPHRAIARQVFRGAERVVTVSSALARAVTGCTEGREPMVIPNLVDTEFFAPSGGVPPASPFTIVSVARLVPEKRIDLLIHAVASLAEKGEDCRLIIGGDGPCRHDLERLAERSGAGHRITFLGRLDREGVRQLLGKAHLLALSSSVETFGVVLIEALAMGVPVVATRCGGPEEIVTDDCGLLVDNGHQEALARALETMVRERDRYHRDRIRARVLAVYDRNVVAGQLSALYTEVMS